MRCGSFTLQTGRGDFGDALADLDHVRKMDPEYCLDVDDAVAHVQAVKQQVWRHVIYPLSVSAYVPAHATHRLPFKRQIYKYSYSRRSFLSAEDQIFVTMLNCHCLFRCFQSRRKWILNLSRLCASIYQHQAPYVYSMTSSYKHELLFLSIVSPGLDVRG